MVEGQPCPHIAQFTDMTVPPAVRLGGTWVAKVGVITATNLIVIARNIGAEVSLHLT